MRRRRAMRFALGAGVLATASLVIAGVLTPDTAPSQVAASAAPRELQALTVDLAQTLVETRRVREQIADVTAETERLQAEIDTQVAEVIAAFESADALVSSLQGELTRQGQIADYRSEVVTQAELAERCTSTLRRAVELVRSGDRSASTTALEDALAPCDAVVASRSGAVYPFDFPDPFVLSTPEGYYAYSTNSGLGDVQVLHSPDLGDWSIVGNALGGLPGWARPALTWAPAIIATDAGYALYYTVADTDTGRQCISRASADHPAGPFHDRSTEPLTCDLVGAGSIDPAPFRDASGDLWLSWSEGADGSGRILTQRLSGDGMTLIGDPSVVLTADRPWEDGTVEGPSILVVDGTHHLFYSANEWRSRDYAVGHAVCSGPSGPCHKTGSGPVLASTDIEAGPGGQTAFVRSDGTYGLAYHAYTEPRVGYPQSRTLRLAEIDFREGGPEVLRSAPST